MKVKIQHDKTKKFFLENLEMKKNFLFSLKIKKKNLFSFFSDKEEKNVDLLKKKKIYFWFFKKCKDNLKNSTNVFLLLMIGIKIKLFLLKLKIFLKLISKKFLFDYLLFSFILWEWETKQEVRFSREILYEGILINLSSELLRKEYFRLTIFLLKKIFGFYELGIFSKKRFWLVNNFFWWDSVFLRIKWSFSVYFPQNFFIQNIFQICMKELWKFLGVYFVNKHNEILLKKFLIKKPLVIGSLLFTFIPKILLLISLIPKILIEIMINVYPVTPFCFFFNYLKVPEKKKNISYKNSFFLGFRNQKQKFKSMFLK